MGTADADFWSERLAAERLRPKLEEGRAQVLISSVSGSWMGLRFRELAASVVCADNETDFRQFYLAGAFSSSSLLAFCERTFFRTPYVQADLAVFLSPPEAIVGERGQTSLQISRHGSSIEERFESLDCEIHLPSDCRNRREKFYARLEGCTEISAFMGKDELLLDASSTFEVVRALCESNFTGRQWHVRRQSRHARSKTFLRDRPAQA